MSRGRCLGIALGLAFPLAGSLSAQNPTDTLSVPAGECCLALTLPLDARNVALGRAVVADTTAGALYANPAGVARLRRARMEVSYRKLPLDQSLIGVALVGPQLAFGTFALAYTLVDYGSVPLYNDQGVEVGNTYSQVHLVGATFATTLAPGLTGGLTFRYFAWVTPCGSLCETKGAGGTTQMVDVGMQYRPRWAPWARWGALGAAVTNAGIPLQVVNFEQKDEPPTRVRVGARYEVLHLFQRDTTLTGSLQAQLELGGPPGPVPAIGAEVNVGDVVSMRAGWRSFGRSRDTFGGSLDAGLALGVGLKFQRFSLSVARALETQPLEESPFHVTFGMSF